MDLKAKHVIKSMSDLSKKYLCINVQKSMHVLLVTQNYVLMCLEKEEKKDEGFRQCQGGL